jgi:hypothetical protein
MDYDRQQPPANLGLLQAGLEHALKHRIQVRYWPLRDAPGRPHVGWVKAWEDRHDAGWGNILWLTGKSGFVSAEHCEFAEVVEDPCNS